MKSATLLGRLMLCSTLLLAMSAHAGMVLSPASQVLSVESYPDYQSGDVIFRISSSVAGCFGFWLPGSDPGFKQTYAALLTAKAAQMNVVVYAYDNQNWPGSGNAFCKVRSVTVQ